MRENVNQNNFEYGHFSRNVSDEDIIWKLRSVNAAQYVTKTII